MLKFAGYVGYVRFGDVRGSVAHLRTISSSGLSYGSTFAYDSFCAKVPSDTKSFRSEIQVGNKSKVANESRPLGNGPNFDFDKFPTL